MHLFKLLAARCPLCRFSCSQQAAEDQAALKAALDSAFAALKVARCEERSRAADVDEARARLSNLQAEEGHMRRLLEDLEKQKVRPAGLACALTTQMVVVKRGTVLGWFVFSKVGGQWKGLERSMPAVSVHGAIGCRSV